MYAASNVSAVNYVIDNDIQLARRAFSLFDVPVINTTISSTLFIDDISAWFTHLSFVHFDSLVRVTLSILSASLYLSEDQHSIFSRASSLNNAVTLVLSIQLNLCPQLWKHRIEFNNTFAKATASVPTLSATLREHVSNIWTKNNGFTQNTLSWCERWRSLLNYPCDKRQ